MASAPVHGQNTEKEDDMRCNLCEKKEAYVECDGCKILLCLECVKSSFYSTGCGNIHPLYLCPKCNDDTDFNP